MTRFLDAKGACLSYLRFSPHEYQTLSNLTIQKELGDCNLPTFKRLLVSGLKETDPGLAQRIVRLRGRRLELLYYHFRERKPPVPSATPYDLDAEERALVVEACVSAPFPVRLVRPFKNVLIGQFEETRPELAQKLRWLSGHQFERLYNQAVGREWWGA
jgi:hypothetical protein